MFSGRRRGQGPGIAVFLLLMQLMRFGIDRIPPITLSTIAANVVIFLKLFKNIHYPSLGEVCVSSFYVWFRSDWRRLIYASVFHADEWHLYYNMISFLWKGTTLEKKFGSAYFLYLLGVFSLLTNVVLVALNMFLEQALEDPSYISQCAVGFSGVIFALKVLTTHYMPHGTNYILGFIPVPTRWAFWAELVVIQVLVPNASFTGHLAGILVGLAYVKGPLKVIMDALIPSTGPRHHYGRSYTYHSGTAAGGSTGSVPHNRRQPERNNDYNNAYTGGMGEDQQMDHAVWASMQDRGPRVSPSAPSQPSPSAPSQPSPSAPPAYNNQNPSTRLYPDLSPHSSHSTSPQNLDDLRQRRLAKLNASA